MFLKIHFTFYEASEARCGGEYEMRFDRIDKQKIHFFSLLSSERDEVKLD